MAVTKERVWLGTMLKFLVEIEAEGFDMDENSFEIKFIGGSGSVVFTKSDLVCEEGEWYVTLDTSLVGSGMVTAITKVDILDDACPGGIRHEIDSQQLCFVSEVEKGSNNGMCKCYL